MRIRSILFMVALLAGCTDLADDKGAEDNVPADLDKADSQRSPTDEGAIASGQTVSATLASTSKYLAWEFDASGDADVSLDTSRAPHAASIDTVMYLYEQGASGWGAYVARNDDAAGSSFSSIDFHVTAGHYRVLVKGYKTTAYGGFLLSYACTGAGCAAADTCAFGDTFHDIDHAKFPMAGPARMTAATILTTLEAAQIVRAMHASSHTDVTTAAQAFAAADDGEINEYQLTDVLGVRRFTAIEYGAGDNSYGAIFDHGTSDVATEIHDGDLESCVVKPAVCVFGARAGDYALNHALTIGTSATYSAKSAVPKAIQPEIVASLHGQRPQVGAIEEIWAQLDGGTFRRVDVTHSDGRVFTILTYGLGGQVYGAAFAKGTATRVDSIANGSNQDCSAF